MRQLQLNQFRNYDLWDFARLTSSHDQMSHLDRDDLYELVEELFERYEHEYYKQLESDNRR